MPSRAPNALLRLLALSLAFAAPSLAWAQDGEEGEAEEVAATPAVTRMVSVTGTPEGASVTVDGQLSGTVPLDLPIGPGTHFFVLRAEGYTTEAQDIAIESSAEPLELRFDLVSTVHTGPKIPMIVGGTVVTLGGLAAGVLAIVGLTGDRQCVARCDEAGGRHVVERPAIDAIVAWTATAVVALAVGIVLIVVGATSSAPPRAGSVSLRPDGLALHF